MASSVAVGLVGGDCSDFAGCGVRALHLSGTIAALWWTTGAARSYKEKKGLMAIALPLSAWLAAIAGVQQIAAFVAFQ